MLRSAGDDGLLTTSQGRDNMVHFYAPLLPRTRAAHAGAPPLLRSIPSNALNFCAFSMAYTPGFGAATAPFIESEPASASASSALSTGNEQASSSSTSASAPTAALLALPNLTDSEFVRPANEWRGADSRLISMSCHHSTASAQLSISCRGRKRDGRGWSWDCMSLSSPATLEGTHNSPVTEPGERNRQREEPAREARG